MEWLKEGEREDVVVVKEGMVEGMRKVDVAFVKGGMVEERRKGRCGCGER